MTIDQLAELERSATSTAQRLIGVIQGRHISVKLFAGQMLFTDDVVQVCESLIAAARERDRLVGLLVRMGNGILETRKSINAGGPICPGFSDGIEQVQSEAIKLAQAQDGSK